MAAHRRPGAIVTTNTSGLPIHQIAEGFDDDFQRHWAGTHFFNPPRYMKLVELIPGPATSPEVLDALADFCDRRLGKGVVRAKDTPNFIANRIGTFSMLTSLSLMTRFGMSVEEVDACTGPAIGWPKSATFRTADIVGLDVLANVVRNIYENAPQDESRELYRVPAARRRNDSPRLARRKIRPWLLPARQKRRRQRNSGARSRPPWNIARAKKRASPRSKWRAPSTTSRARLQAILASRYDRRPARRQSAAIPLGADLGNVRFTPRAAFPKLPIPSSMSIAPCAGASAGSSAHSKYATRWALRPWRAAGPPKAATLPPLVHATARLRPQITSTNRPPANFPPSIPPPAAVTKVPEPPGIIILKSLKDRSKEVARNSGASLIDLGDGVLCCEFHSKMNAIGDDITAMMQTGLKRLNTDFDAMVIANQAPNFSVGANLMLLLVAAQEQEWDDIHDAVRHFQNANLALKHAPQPVVVAPQGMALGGGCEVCLHGARIHAAAEAYMGLVETGVGLIPAGGGSKEMIIRANEHAAGRRIPATSSTP